MVGVLFYSLIWVELMCNLEIVNNLEYLILFLGFLEMRLEFLKFRLFKTRIRIISNLVISKYIKL